MEAVSLVASIITLINAATLTGASLTRLMSLRGCPSYAASALNEVNDFQATLSLVKSVLDVGEIPGDVLVAITRCIDRGTMQLDSFGRYMKDKVLQDQNSVDDAARPKLRRRAKFKKIVGEGHQEIHNFQKELHSVKHDLVRIVPKLFMSIQQISTVHAGTTPPPSVGVTGNASIAQGIERATFLYEHQHHDSTTQVTTSHNRCPMETYVKIDTKPLSRTCQRKCPCQCHIPLEAATPRWLQGLIGIAFVNFTGAPTLNHRSCDFNSCANSNHGTGSVRFSYLFPAWLLRSSIKFTASWGSLSGVTGSWTLRIPRVIDNSEVYNRLLDAVKFFPMHKLRREMEILRVRAFDHFPFDAGQHWSLLQMASTARSHKTCCMLLDAGADPTFPTEAGLTTAQYHWLLNPSSSGLGPQNVHPDLLDMRDEYGLTSIYNLIRHGDNAMLERQLELNPRYVMTRDVVGATPLHWAVFYHEEEAISILLAAGADLNVVCKMGSSILIWAVESQSVECCRAIVAAGTGVSCTGPDGTAADAVCSSHSETSASNGMDVVRSSGLNLEARDSERRTPLMVAAALGCLDICDLLLHHGANIEARNQNGKTALHEAVQRNHAAVLRFLLDRGASMTTLDNQGVSILHYAAGWADIHTMDILREACMEGLRMDTISVKTYWECFADRDRTMFDRAPLDEEKAAFQSLLDSVVPCHDPPHTDDNEILDVLYSEQPLLDTDERFDLPGAYPLDPVEDAAFLESSE